MKTKVSSRLLSMFLAVTMLLGYMGMVAVPEAEAAMEYATPATEAELSAVPEWFGADNGQGEGVASAFAKLINGSVYVWGRNTAYVLGITSYTNAAGDVIPVVNGTSVPVPTPIPASAFNNEKVTRIAITYHSGLALTDQNNLYVWGSYLGSSLSLGTCTTPTKLDTSNIGSKKIVDVKHTGYMVYIKCEDNTWYTCGACSAGALLQGTAAPKVPTLVPASTYAAIGNKTIKDINGEWQAISLVLTTDGYLYGFGTQNGSSQSTGINTTQSFTTTAADLCATSTFSGKRFVYITGEDQAFAAIDTEGDVWGWGSNSSNRLGATNSVHLGANTKIFDHNVYQKKAVRVLLSFNTTVIICDDNTVYAMGNNASGSIVPGGAASIATPTQIFSELSQLYTIVGVFPNHSGIMAITKSGDMYYAGDNTYGGAGNGTTQNASSGTIQTVTSSTMPPSVPLTKNKVSFEIEVTEDNKTVTYAPVSTGNGTTYQKKEGNGTPVTVNDLTVDAGSNFKLNVYFEDFGKINTFVMPIRFNPEYLEVVNGNGKAYSRDSEVVTPGAVGASVGVEQTFTIQQWQGGSLAVGTKDGTYPKISNADGWISVAGYSADSNPIIKDKVKMFSISFRARNTVSGNGIFFDFATQDNYLGDGAPTGNGYDITCNGLEGGKAYWSIYNASGNGGESGYFEFDSDPFPRFNSKLVILRALTMTLTYGANNTEVTEVTEAPDPTPGWAINWSNTNVTYTLTANPYSDVQKTKKGASFPQVSWSFATNYINGANNANREWSDYITVIDNQDTYVRFKINPNFHPVTDEDPGFIKVTATSQYYTGVSTVYYIKLLSYEAPDTLELAQMQDGVKVALTDGQEITYHYRNDGTSAENYNFVVDFGTAHNNLEVVWDLLDKDGDPLDLSDPSAKITMTKNADGSATLEPHYTTAGEDYVILHVESLYDSSKYDEAIIRIHLYATQLGFNPSTIRMAVMKEGIPSTINLSSYVQVQPVDVYATNYTWAITDNPTRDPSNATKVDPSFIAGTPVTYGTMGTGSTASTFTAFEYATPVAGEDEAHVSQPEEFVTVTVTDTLSGKSASVKIAIMDLNSPIGIEDFATTNNLGYKNDTVMIKQGLKLGDIIDFYPTYEDAINKTNRYSRTTIVEGMYPYFTFVVGSNDGGLMKGEGGFLAVQLTRPEASGNIEYDAVPVSYSAEPSLVDGYAHLYGKNTGSIADKDIRIDLEGLNFKETVYTDQNGYFKFTKYIAPGTYTMVISKANYLTRRITPDNNGNGGLSIQVNDDGEFHISTYNQPILLFPGELTNDNAITVQDINYYVANWVGQYDGNINNFDSYDFLEDNLITLRDLELLLMRKDWISGSYPVWTVPNQ